MTNRLSHEARLLELQRLDLKIHRMLASNDSIQNCFSVETKIREISITDRIVHNSIIDPVAHKKIRVFPSGSKSHFNLLLSCAVAMICSFGMGYQTNSMLEPHENLTKMAVSGGSNAVVLPSPKVNFSLESNTNKVKPAAYRANDTAPQTDMKPEFDSSTTSPEGPQGTTEVSCLSTQTESNSSNGVRSNESASTCYSSYSFVRVSVEPDTIERQRIPNTSGFHNVTDGDVLITSPLPAEKPPIKDSAAEKLDRALKRKNGRVYIPTIEPTPINYLFSMR